MPPAPSPFLARPAEAKNRYGGGGFHFRSSPERRQGLVGIRNAEQTPSPLVQQEPDRLHCWALIVALASSVTGMTLLITAALR